jgi:outer membrane protein assembly factor BamB
MGDEVVATDPVSGKEKWSRKLDGDVAKSGGALATTPAATENGLFVGTLAGEILQMDPKSGEVVKTWKIGSPIRSQPIVHQGWIYAGTEDGKLVAIDTKDKAHSGWTQWGGNAARTGTL